MSRKCIVPICQHRRSRGSEKQECSIARQNVANSSWIPILRAKYPTLQFPEKGFINMCECHLLLGSRLDRRIDESKLPDIPSGPTPSQLQEEINTLKKRLTALQIENKYLKDLMSKHFTPSQLALLNGRTVSNYDDKTKVHAINILVGSSTETYEYISKNVIPLPSVSIVRSWISFAAKNEE